MLEFIVLGLVPGTQIQITFTWVLAAVAGSLVFYEIQSLRRHKQFAEQQEENLS